jgi:hypothetical protein
VTLTLPSPVTESVRRFSAAGALQFTEHGGFAAAGVAVHPARSTAVANIPRIIIFRDIFPPYSYTSVGLFYPPISPYRLRRFNSGFVPIS